MISKHNSISVAAAVAFIFVASSLSAQDAVVDLSRVDFSQPGIQTISGNWQFYWNRLLTPEDFARHHQEGELMMVPGAWNRQGQYPAIGFATYRVKLKLPANNHALAIFFPVINCAARIWINGEQVAESGVVSDKKSIHKSKLAGTLVEIPPNAGDLELIIQVSNHSYFIGGFSGAPQLGKISQLISQMNQSQGVENFFSGSLMAMFIYQLVLYFLYKRGKSYLWLSLICLGVALRALVVHSGFFLLPNLFPSVSWEFWKKIEFESVYAITAFFPLYIYNLFPAHAPRWPIKFFIGLSSLCCLIVLVTPQNIYGLLLEVDHAALLLAFIYAIHSVGKAWRNGSKEARTILIGVLLSFPFIAMEILKNSLFHTINIQFLHLAEMGVLVFLLFQVYLLANHYANSYKNLETLNQNLEKMVGDRTHQLIAANHVRDRLLSIVTHDLKSPLNSLRGVLSVYNKGLINSNDFSYYSKKIEDDLTKTGLLVDNILHWTSSQLKGVQIKNEVFDLRDLLQQNVELFQTIALQKKLKIKNSLTESCVINFDRNILDLTIRNLISNSIKFSNEGFEIIIRCEISSNQLLIRVVDFGIGMSDEVLKSLQNSETTKSTEGTGNEKGTGLGLSFCKEYLKSCGGELQIESKLGEGSTFTIVIPYRNVKKQSTPLEKRKIGTLELNSLPS